MNAFQKTRLKLTVWYILISLFLLTISSLAAIRAEQSAFDRILSVVSNPSRPRLTELFERSIADFEQNFKKRLFLFDGALLVIASVTSYFLSGLTLKPIQEMVDMQEEFAANASHELRTPLTTIGMEIEALKRTEAKVPKQYSELFDSVLEEVQRMKGIVDGLLTLVRYNSIHGRKNWQKIDLTPLVKDAYSQMQQLANAKHINYQFHQNGMLSVYGSSDQIKQVILILLDNAIKYTQEDGTIHVSLQKTRNHASISVSDTGYGIVSSDLKHIFDRFFRAHSHMVQKGSGLGLAIAKKIVEDHNGIISVQSTVGKGSKFTVTFLLHP